MNDEIKNPDVHQEEDTIPWGRVLFGFLLSLLIIAVLIAMAFRNLTAGEAKIRPSGVFPEEHLGPRSEVAEVQADLFGDKGFGQALNEKKQRELSSFDWVDRERRRVRIPIAYAMELVVMENQR